MLVHGGPWARNFWGYSSEAQFFANRGYAVLMPNFRGSTGYGKKYLNAGNKQWGTGAMQHDISDGVKYIERTGVADPKRVGIYGGSYGGYATLAGLAFTPNLYAAGISYVGPSNIITLLKSIPAYWAPMKKVFAIRVGDMDKPKEREMLERQSPLNSADKIKAPLLVIQGANDPRVNKGESDRIVIAVRDLGHPVEYLVAPDEGHGFAGKLNRLAAYTAMEKFFGKYLGGRCQESMTPEIGKKLASLTVDVKTVTAQTTTSSDESVAVPPVFDPSLVKADSVAYTIKYTMNGQEISMAVARIVAIVQSGPAKIWRVIDNAHSPMGDASDTVEIDAGTLRANRQSATQGPMIMKYTFTPDSINGIVSAGPNSMPVKLKVTTLTLPDGAGLELPIATLPLKEGYRTSLDVFTPMLGKSTTMTVRVGGIEKVTVPAGTFDAYPVSVVSRTDEDGYQKYWFAKDSRKLVKSEAKLPATMGGGSVAVVMVK
jgi:dienelactone hydrolase